MIKKYYSIQLKVFVLLTFGLVSSCSEPDDEAEKVMNGFFKLVLRNKDKKAADLVDTKAVFYKNRFLVIDEIQKHPKFGQMKPEKRFGFFASSSLTRSNYFVTTVEKNYDVYYDSVHINYKVKLIDRGDGFKVLNLKKNGVSKNYRF